MELINPLAQAYAERFSSPEDPVLAQIARTTHESHAHAHMLSGHLQGKLLRFISELVRPRRILEIGTFTGYSAVCLAAGLQPGGKLHTIEFREEEATLAENHFRLAGLQNEIVLHRGNALDILPFLIEDWDLVFLDADKQGYLAYYKLLAPQLKKGGIILADNVLFHGEVLEEKIVGKNALAIQAFNEYVRSDETVETIMLTVRDGLLVVIKK